MPIGERACAWIEKYLYTIRPSYLDGEDHGVLFLAKHGGGMDGKQLSGIVKKAIERAAWIGSRTPTRMPPVTCCATRARPTCWRTAPTSATSRRLLGHADLSTTEVYTRVSILKLKEVHAQTHPARLTRTGEAMLDSIAANLSTVVLPSTHDPDHPNLEE